MSALRAIGSARLKRNAEGRLTGPIHVGTTGWSIASRYLRSIPRGGTHLERYGRAFPVVEVSSSFYRHHQPQTYARWAHDTGDDFEFSVKTPRELTHGGSLLDRRSADLDAFLAEVAGLGPKLRAVLVQLPPGLVFDPRQVRRFFRRLRDGLGDAAAIVCEPRHVSWSAEAADALLRDLRICRAAVDPPRWERDATPGGDTRLAYFRLHGSPRIYYSPYGAARLRRLAAQLEDWSTRSDEVWCIFDNTAHGHAIGNALSLQQMLV